MICIDAFQQNLSEHNSRGNQIKFYNRGYWYKIDSPICYEGLAEEFVSLLESCIVNFPYVSYKSTLLSYNDAELVGCYSYNMYNRPDVTFVSLRHLLRTLKIPLNIFIKLEDTAENIKSTVNTLYSLTGLNLFPYFSRLIMLDCLIINEDRHLMNLGVCKCLSDSHFYEAPCFDNGASLFCTSWTYRKSKTMEQNYQAARSVARPFSKFYDKQLEAVLRLGAAPLQISKAGVSQLMGYSNSLYPDFMVARVKEVLSHQLQQYEGSAFIYI